MGIRRNKYIDERHAEDAKCIDRMQVFLAGTVWKFLSHEAVPTIVRILIVFVLGIGSIYG